MILFYQLKVMRSGLSRDPMAKQVHNISLCSSMETLVATGHLFNPVGTSLTHLAHDLPTGPLDSHCESL